MSAKATNPFKRLKLVDEEELQRLIERQIRDYNPALRAMADRKQEIANLMDRRDVTDEEKLALFEANKQRYAEHQNAFDGTQQLPQRTVTLPSSTAAAAAATPERVQQADAAAAARGAAGDGEEWAGAEGEMKYSPDVFVPIIPTLPEIPPTHQQKLNYLGALIEGSAGAIQRNTQTGEIILDGESIPKSSFNDLIKEFFVTSKKPNLTGQSKLLQVISRLLRPGGRWESVRLKSIIPRTLYLSKLKLLKPPSPPSEQSGMGKRKVASTSLGTRSNVPPGQKIKTLRLY